MRTDVVLIHAFTGRRIVIDTKFTSIVTSGRYRDETLRSGYVYQIYAYLQSQFGRGDPLADCASGLLLPPSVGDAVDETVDLTASPREIRSKVLRLCEPAIQ